MAEILLFHHAQGQTPGFVAFADELRAAGHTVHAPDLYDGNTFDDIDAGVGYAKQVGFGEIMERGRLSADGLPNEIVYGAAKAGVNNLAYGMARTFGPKVRVNSIVPGPFLTDISKAWDLESFNERAKAGFALGRGGEPGEIVGAALYFATAAGSYSTGTTLNVDGGPV